MWEEGNVPGSPPLLIFLVVCYSKNLFSFLIFYLGNRAGEICIWPTRRTLLMMMMKLIMSMCIFVSHFGRLHSSPWCPPPVDWFHFFCQCVVSDVLADSLAAGKNESNNFCLFEMEAKRKVFWVERQRKWGHRRSGWRQAAAVVIFLRKKNGRGLRWYARLGV